MWTPMLYIYHLAAAHHKAVARAAGQQADSPVVFRKAAYKGRVAVQERCPCYLSLRPAEQR